MEISISILKEVTQMTLEFWKAAAIRAIKTFAQAMVAQIGAGSVGIVAFDWAGALSVSAMAAILSIFTSLAGLPEIALMQTVESYNNDPDEDDVEEYEEDEFDETEEVEETEENAEKEA